MARKKKKNVDPDLEIWARLGGSVVETEVDDGLTSGQRIMEAGNQWAREQLQPARPLIPSIFAVNPFRRDR
jgi:hypothetical protein